MRYIVTLLIAVVMGCSSASPPVTPGQAAALQTAEKWLGSQRIDPHSVKLSASPDGAGWSVTIERQPPTPGAHTILRIDANGDVIDVIPGR